MRGITVTLYERTQTSTDPFGAPVYTETPVDVENVLVGKHDFGPTTDDMTTRTDLEGKKIEYTLAIPKGDAHDWTDARVSWTDAYGRTIVCKTFGFPITGVEHLVPTPWHMKVRCMRVE